MSSLGEGKSNQKKTAITTVKKKATTSYNETPISLRMSAKDKQAINDWVEELQEMTPRSVSSAKLFRALTMMKDEIDQDRLIELISEMR